MKKITLLINVVVNLHNLQDIKCENPNFELTKYAYSEHKKTGQNASQAISLACEQVTDHKFIVASVFHNKLCWTGAWLKGKGLDVTCPDGHAGTCTANVKPTTPLSEYLMGKEIGLQVDRQNVLIKYAVTDGDGRGAEGINDALKVLHPLWKVERQADPIHLGRSQF
ncbi:unnamed protein product [Mytilus coruscus]|uniref:Mutator-like transposase domain-containing protein n=1 Tax=Mytilus coruscus TaxID=42192 RepID=A0A6J8DF03_MYTCO|nr:unnamed protein product [Mytilus coruscus]